MEVIIWRFYSQEQRPFDQWRDFDFRHRYDCDEQPSITKTSRFVDMDATVTGPTGLQLGLYGGAVANPINILAQMIASLQDEQQRITIPGFDKVLELSKEERAEMAKAPFDLETKKSLA